MPTVDPNNPDRFLFSTSSRYEFQFGYSRAIRHGRVVRVAGTAGIGPDGQVVSDDVIDQMRAALQTMRDALADLGCGLGDVIMTRIYVKNTSDIDGDAVVQGEPFRDISPATTSVRVGESIDPRILVELEAEADSAGAGDKEGATCAPA